jgi:Tfp pilus assembly protein PilN
VRAVNLLPPDARGKGLDEGARTPLLAAGAGIALVTVLATFAASLASVDASDTRSRVEAVESAIEALPEPEHPAVDTAALVQERSDRESALAVALTGRVAFDTLMRQISLVLPEDAWLTQLSATAPAPAATEEAAAAAPAPESDSVTIQGATWSHDGVAVVLGRLGALPTLTGVRLTGSTRVEPQEAEGSSGADRQPGKPYVTFVISATMSTGDES